MKGRINRGPKNDFLKESDVNFRKVFGIVNMIKEDICPLKNKSRKLQINEKQLDEIKRDNSWNKESKLKSDRIVTHMGEKVYTYCVKLNHWCRR